MPASASATVGSALAILKAQPLWACHRSADVAQFQFGKRRASGKPSDLGDYALHVRCPWRVLRKNRILVGSDDLFFPAGYNSGMEPPPDFDWQRQPNRLDKLRLALFTPGRPVLSVRKIEVGLAGSFRLLFDDKMALEVFPASSRRVEHWRLLARQAGEPLFVLTGAEPE